MKREADVTVDDRAEAWRHDNIRPRQALVEHSWRTLLTAGESSSKSRRPGEYSQLTGGSIVCTKTAGSDHHNQRRVACRQEMLFNAGTHCFYWLLLGQ